MKLNPLTPRNFINPLLSRKSADKAQFELFKQHFQVYQQKAVIDGISTAVKRTLKNKLNHKKQNKRVVTELKGAETTFAVKEYFARNLPDEGWDIYGVALNKA